MRNTTGIVVQGTAGTRTRLLTALIAIVPVLLLGSCDWLGSLFGADDYEPNDSISAAYGIERDESYSAYIGEDDADFFSFTTAHGSSTFDEVEISVTGVGSDLKILVAIYDPDGELYGSKTSTTGGADLTYTLRSLQSDGTYTVRFSGSWGSSYEVDGAGDYWTEGAYTFQVKNLDANDNFAGNHSIDDAEAMELGTSYEGILVSKYEADFFAFTPTSANMQLQVTNVGSDLYTGVAIYRPDKTLLGQVQTTTAGANLTVDMNGYGTTETYYLRFSGTWGSGTPTGGWTVDGIGDFYSRGPYTFVLNEN